MRTYNVIPFAMKTHSSQWDGIHFLLGHRLACGVFRVVKTAGNRQALDGLCRPDQTHHRLVITQSLPAPVRGDERKQTVPDGVPLARPGRKMAHTDRKAKRRGKVMQTALPKTAAPAVRTAPVRRDQ